MKRGFRVTAFWQLNENFLSVYPEFQWRRWKRKTSGTVLSSTTLDWVAVYHDFPRNVLPELLENVDLLTGILLRSIHDGAAPYFLLVFQEFLNNLFPEKRIVRGGPAAWTAPSPDLKPLLFLYLGTSAAYCLCYRSQWRPGLSTMDTERIRDDSHDTWNFPVNQAIAVKTHNVLRWSSRWTLRAFSLTYKRPSLGGHASELQGS